MSLTRILCPDCGAGLASKAGFVIGQPVTCPKCKTPFKVSAPFEEVKDDTPSPPTKAPAEAKKTVRAVVAVVEDDEDEDEDEDERPKKKKKKKRRDEDEDEDEEGSSYRNSWIRYTILGILVIVMLVLAYFLYEKWKPQKETAEVKAEEGASNPPPPRMGIRGLPGQGPGIPGQGPGIPGQGPELAGTRRPKTDPKIGQNPPLAGLGGFDPLAVPQTPAQIAERTAKLSQKLIGTWEGTSSDGATHRIEYRADMTFSHTIQGGAEPGTTMGKYVVTGLIGNKVLTLARPLGTGNMIKVTFEDDELIHDTATPGESIILRKKS